jgi:hypothetical protein
MLRGFALLCLAIVLFALPCQARIVRVVVQSSAPLPVSRTGQAHYEEVKGLLYGELDPSDPHNTIIQDIALAPRNARGRVEYSSTFTLLIPSAPTRCSGFLVYEVVNRGGTIVPKDFSSGDIFLSSGWQGDIPFGAKSAYGTDAETIRVPVAHQQDGSPITGPILLRFLNIKPGLHTLAARSAIGYASSGPAPFPAVLDSAQAEFTSRAYESVNGASSPVTQISSEDWRWADCTATPFPGKPDPTHICARFEFDPNLLYQVAYTGKDPLVLGVGLAAIRDAVAFFHLQTADSQGKQNPISPRVKHVIGVGASQSGNAIRTFLNLGFNEDEDGHQVWEAVMPTIAVRQTPVNLRFAIPGGASNLYEPGSEGTVWWTSSADTGRNLPASSLLRRCTATHTCPKVIEVLGASEFWSLRATPNFVGTSESNDMPLPANVRRYYIAGTQHGGGTGGFQWQPRPRVPLRPNAQNPIATASCVLPLNPNPELEIDNALFVALKQWVLGQEPPPSVFPRLADHTLVLANAHDVRMPFIPGLPSPDGVANPLLVYSFGESFQASDISGMLTHNPPAILNVLPAMATAVNRDGNEIAGVQTVLLQAPLGTYLGWNVTEEGFSKGQYCSLYGGYIPFAKDRGERIARHDSRPSLEERYGNKRGYLCVVHRAAVGLVQRRLLLPADADKLESQALHDNNVRDVVTPAAQAIADQLCSAPHPKG